MPILAILECNRETNFQRFCSNDNTPLQTYLAVLTFDAPISFFKYVYRLDFILFVLLFVVIEHVKTELKPVIRLVLVVLFV